METNYQQLCWNCMNKYVGIVTSDGQTHDGFIAHVDNDYVTLAIPTNEMVNRLSDTATQESAYRPFGFHPGFYPRRRFYPRRFPYYGISDLFLLPFFV